jgi:hypothetical protein
MRRGITAILFGLFFLTLDVTLSTQMTWLANRSLDLLPDTLGLLAIAGGALPFVRYAWKFGAAAAIATLLAISHALGFWGLTFYMRDWTSLALEASVILLLLGAVADFAEIGDVASVARLAKGVQIFLVAAVVLYGALGWLLEFPPTPQLDLARLSLLSRAGLIVLLAMLGASVVGIAAPFVGIRRYLD